MRMSEVVYDLVVTKLQNEFDRIDYFSDSYDPAWYFDAVDQLYTQFLEHEFDWLTNPCSALSGWMWKNIPARGRYQYAARNQLSGALLLLDREVKKLLSAVIAQCGAV